MICLPPSRRVDMVIVTGEVVADPSGTPQFLVICKFGDEVISSWPVRTEKEGEAQLVEGLRGLALKARDEGLL
jgi:hypothetical protein